MSGGRSKDTSALPTASTPSKLTIAIGKERMAEAKAHQGGQQEALVVEEILQNFEGGCASIIQQVVMALEALVIGVIFGTCLDRWQDLQVVPHSYGIWI